MYTITPVSAGYSLIGYAVSLTMGGIAIYAGMDRTERTVPAGKILTLLVFARSRSAFETSMSAPKAQSVRGV